MTGKGCRQREGEKSTKPLKYRIAKESCFIRHPIQPIYRHFPKVAALTEANTSSTAQEITEKSCRDRRIKMSSERRDTAGVPSLLYNVTVVPPPAAKMRTKSDKWGPTQIEEQRKRVGHGSRRESQAYLRCEGRVRRLGPDSARVEERAGEPRLRQRRRERGERAERRGDQIAGGAQIGRKAEQEGVCWEDATCAQREEESARRESGEQRQLWAR